MKDVIEARIAEIEAKIAARKGAAGYETSVVACKATIAELRNLLAQLESDENV